ncbi:MAG: cytochrome c biogenesis protein [Patescibacteria group bacterium]
MKWLKPVIFGLAMLLAVAVLSLVVVKPSSGQKSGAIYYFWGQGCAHCARVDEVFSQNGWWEQYPIEKKEIYADRSGVLFFNQLLDDLDYPKLARGVPTMVIGNQVLSGDQPIIDEFVKLADEFLAKQSVLTLDQDSAKTATPEEAPVASSPAKSNAIGIPDLPIQLHPADFDSGLTLAAVIGGSLVDAINPCAFAVLIILMATVMVGGDRQRALMSGLAFSASVFISYLLMGLGLYHALSISGLSSVLFKVVGWLAIILALLNFKDFFWYGKGFLMEVPQAWRPKMKALLMSVTSPMGAFAVGFMVSLILLPCTSGPYVVILSMLAKNTQPVQAVLYLILYNLIFVSPMVLISLAVYKGFKPETAETIRQKHLKNLHLVAGIVLLAMGVLVLSGTL